MAILLLPLPMTDRARVAYFPANKTFEIEIHWYNGNFPNGDLNASRVWAGGDAPSVIGPKRPPC